MSYLTPLGPADRPLDFGAVSSKSDTWSSPSSESRESGECESLEQRLVIDHREIVELKRDVREARDGHDRDRDRERDCDRDRDRDDSHQIPLEREPRRPLL